MIFGWLAAILLLVSASPAAAEPPSDADLSSVMLVGGPATDGSGEVTGTGFVIAPGRLATNAHVVEPLERYFVLPPDSDRPLEGRLLWFDRGLDLAVIEVPGLRATPLRLSLVPPRRGGQVYAVGYPGSSLRLQIGNERIASTLAAGNITSTYPTSWGEGSRRLQVIQHDAATGQGNSGGPLFDECGRVIGVNTAGPGGDINGNRIPDQTFFASSIIELKQALDVSPHRIALSVSDQTCAQLAAARPPVVAPRQPVTAPAPVAETSGGGEPAILAWMRGQPTWLWIAIALVALAFAGLVALRLRHVATVPAGPAASSLAKRSAPPASPAGPKPWPALVAENGERSIPLDPALLARPAGLVVGRNAHYCDHRLDSDDVSRRHLRLMLTDGRLMAEDLNSAQGSFVAHRRLTPFTPVAVAPGDPVKLAGHGFRLDSIAPGSSDLGGARGPLATVLIGRNAECNLQLGDSSVSRRHAELVLGDDGRVMVSDRCSTHGTFVLRGDKWRRIDHLQLDDGMKLRFGTVEIPARRLIAAARAAMARPRAGDVRGSVRDTSGGATDRP